MLYFTSIMALMCAFGIICASDLGLVSSILILTSKLTFDCRKKVMSSFAVPYKGPKLSPLLVEPELPSETAIDSYPFIVTIFANEQFVCSATIISPKFAITAFRCVQNLTNDITQRNVYLRGGTDNAINGGYLHAVIQLFVNRPIVLLQVDELFILEKDEKPITVLSNRFDVVYGSPLLALGWADRNHSKEMNITEENNNLKGIELFRLQPKHYTQYFPKEKHVPAALYAGVFERKRKRCIMDIGGPLIVHNVLVGVHIRGADCLNSTYPSPGVFLNVRGLKTWLNTFNKKQNANIKFSKRIDAVWPIVHSNISA